MPRKGSGKHENNKFRHRCTFKTLDHSSPPPTGQSEKWLEDWQKIADEQTAKALELYIARVKQNPPLRPY